MILIDNISTSQIYIITGAMFGALLIIAGILFVLCTVNRCRKKTFSSGAHVPFFTSSNSRRALARSGNSVDPLLREKIPLTSLNLIENPNYIRHIKQNGSTGMDKLYMKYMN